MYFMPAALASATQVLGVEFFGIEECRQAVVFVDLEMALVEDPLAVAEHAVDAPVDEHAELHVLKFAAGLQVFGGRLVVGWAEAHNAKTLATAMAAIRANLAFDK